MIFSFSLSLDLGLGLGLALALGVDLLLAQISDGLTSKNTINHFFCIHADLRSRNVSLKLWIKAILVNLATDASNQ